jgi:hypothetical protein
MATIRLGRYEAEDGDMPEVCMRCGAPATFHKRYRFVWHPAWCYVLILVALIAYIIVAAVLTQQARIHVFLCDRHKRHWLVRTLIIWGSFLGLILLLIGGIAVVAAVDDRTRNEIGDYAGFYCIGLLVLAAAWLISIPIIQWTAIHPTEITERTVSLTRVCPEYADALVDHRARRRREEDEDDGYRRKFRPGRRRDEEVEFYDPEPRRRRRARHDEYEEYR